MNSDLRILLVWTLVGAICLVLQFVILVRAWPLTQSFSDKLWHVLIPVLPAWTLWKNQRRIAVVVWGVFLILYALLRIAFR